MPAPAAPAPPREAALHSADEVPESAAKALSSRLAALPETILPSSLYQACQAARPSTVQVQEYLFSLIRTRPATFLERHGRLLAAAELQLFASLRQHSFEVEHWVRQAQAALATAADPLRLPAAVRNRRFAHMRRLQAGGDFFSEQAIKQRAPLLYHQLLGQHQGEEAPDSAASAARQAQPGRLDAGQTGAERAEALMSQLDEVNYQERLAAEQQEEDAQLSEEEEEEEAVAGDGEAGGGQECPASQEHRGADIAPAVGRNPGRTAMPVMSGEELAEQRRQLMREMEVRFLTGLERHHVDYSRIDVDGDLDTDLLAQQGRDAEDAWFSDED